MHHGRLYFIFAYCFFPEEEFTTIEPITPTEITPTVPDLTGVIIGVVVAAVILLVVFPVVSTYFGMNIRRKSNFSDKDQTFRL